MMSVQAVTSDCSVLISHVENNLSTGWAIKTMFTHPGSQRLY